MKILVTGGSGFIGSNLIRRLFGLGHNIFSIDKACFIQPENSNIITYTAIEGDICDESFLHSIDESDFDILFHFAANANVPSSVANPINDFRINAVGTLNMLEFSRRKKVKKFIFSSSVSVFNSNNSLPLDENSKLKVSSPYGASKLSGESYCYAYNRTYGLNTNVVRFFNVYGEGINKLFIFDIIRKVLNAKEEIVITGDGHQIRDYLFIDDLIDGIILVAEKGLPGEDYNIASGKKIEIIEIIRKILFYMGRSGLIIKTTNKSYPGDIKEWYANISKIESLGFKPMIDFDNGLKRTIESVIDRLTN